MLRLIKDAENDSMPPSPLAPFVVRLYRSNSIPIKQLLRVLLILRMELVQVLISVSLILIDHSRMTLNLLCSCGTGWASIRFIRTPTPV
jgi:hypothetical protein